MLRSMTGYGRSHRENSFGRFTVEIQSINRKHFEIQTTLYPSALLRFESHMRKLTSGKLSRGQINLKVNINFDQTSTQIVTPNLPLARQVKNGWELIAHDLKIPLDPKELFHSLALTPDILQFGEELEDEELLLTEILTVISEALDNLIIMREKEGQHLQQDISARLAKLNEWMLQISERAKGGTQKYYEKLKARLDELLGESIENEERILREIALYAEKIDITEEVIRFLSHVKQFHQLLANAEGASGKAIEFLLQELSRETNTIGSKTSDIEITRLVLDLKNELERIREQIQNVE